MVPIEEELKEIQGELDDLYGSGAIDWVNDVVGEELANIQDVNELVNLVKNRRADTLKEVLNVYDNIRHQTRMEEMQYSIQQAAEATAVETAKQTEQLRVIEKNTHQAASASKAAAASAYATYKTAKKVNKNTKRIYKKL